MKDDIHFAERLSYANDPDKPWVHVLIPTYNHRQYIGRTIESVCNQWYPHWILDIYIDGGNVDAYNPVREAYRKYSNIYWNSMEHNFGRAHARNTLLEISANTLPKVQLCAWIDSDDIMMPDRLSKQVEYMTAHPEVDVLATQMIHLHPNGCMECAGGRAEQYEGLTSKSLETYNPISNPTVMFKREVLRSIGYCTNRTQSMSDAEWREAQMYEDLHLWRKLYQQGKRVHCLTDRLTIYRVGTHS